MDKASSESESADDKASRARAAAFLRDVALGKRAATGREVNRACKQLDRYLADPVLEDF